MLVDIVLLREDDGELLVPHRSLPRSNHHVYTHGISTSSINPSSQYNSTTLKLLGVQLWVRLSRQLEVVGEMGGGCDLGREDAVTLDRFCGIRRGRGNCLIRESVACGFLDGL